MAEANKDFKMDGTIHWEKFRLMGDTILAMIRFQEPKFSIQPDARILGFIAETELMNEDVGGWRVLCEGREGGLWTSIFVTLLT